MASQLTALVHVAMAMRYVCSSTCRLEGDVPSLEKTETHMLGGAPGFATPQLPRPGQSVTRKNALRIEK